MDSSGGATTQDSGTVGAPARRPRRLGIGVVVVGSVVVGLVAALVLPFLPVSTVDVDVATAMVLLGFAVGWASLAGLSAWLTDQPHRWALAPAAFMALSAVVVLLAPDAVVNGVLGWVWPPALLVLVVWVVRRARRELHSRTRFLVLYPVLAVLVLFSVGGLYEKVGETSDTPASAVGGRLVDVGPYRLHLECTGSGNPTVVLAPGAGGSAASMGLIAPAVARETRVCVYDRAGRGWSDPAAAPPDGAQIATDLHRLLARAHVPGPYVLAGHSFGGLYVRSYAAKYPDEVAGLVLVDSTAARNDPVTAPEPGPDGVLRHVSSLFGATSRLGLGRLIAATSSGDLPPAYRDDTRTTAATAKQMSGVLEEYGVANRSAPEAGRLRSLHAKPLVVLTAERGSAPGWMADQDASAELSTNSVHRVVPGATHASFVEDPDKAAAVSRAIQQVVTAVRSSTPLPSG